MNKRLQSQRFAEDGNLCSFGITEALAAGIASLSGGLVTGGLATGLAGGLEGAAAGAGLSAIEGQPIGRGALTGALTGGAIGGLAPSVSGALTPALGDAAGSVAPALVGAGAGLVGSEITGQSPVTGAITGGAAGLLSGVAGGGATPSVTPSATPAGGITGGGQSAAAAALPGGLPAGTAPLDLTTINQPILGNAGGGPNFSGALTDVGAGSGLPPSLQGGAGSLPGVAAPAPSAGAFDPAALPVAGPQDFSSATEGGIGSGLSSLLHNPGALLGAGVLGIEGMKANQPLPEQTQLNQLAARTAGQGANLMNYINTGTLPPGAQDAVNQSTQAAKAAVRANYAQLGLTGSTMEAEALANVDRASAAQTEQIAQGLLSQGANLTTLSADLYQNLLKDTLGQDQAFQEALSRFAAGLAGARTPGTG